MSSFYLKIIGIITMLIDHIGLLFYDETILRIIGRISFPIFAYQASLSYRYTKNIKKHFIKLSIFAIISQIPYYLMTKEIGFHFNILFTILLGQLSIYLYNKFNNLFDKILYLLLICILGICLRVEYSCIGILTIFFFYQYKDNKIKSYLSFIILFTIYYLIYYIFNKEINNIYLLIGTISSLIPISLYNNKEGIKLKYFFYIFYPLHMIILYLIALYIK